MTTVIPSSEIVCISIDRNKLENGYTWAMHYIINTKSVPPEFIWNDPEIRDKDGNTLGMLWMIHLHKEPPESFGMI